MLKKTVASWAQLNLKVMRRLNRPWLEREFASTASPKADFGVDIASISEAVSKNIASKMPLVDVASIAQATSQAVPATIPVVYLGEGLCITRTIHHDTICFPARDMLLAPPLIFVRDYEPSVTRVLCQMLQPGMTFVDIGANIGCHMVRAAKLVGPKGKVIAFEPMPHNFDILHRNIFANGINSIVKAERLALSNAAGTLKINFMKDFAGNGTSLDCSEDYARQHNRALESLNVPVAVFDEYMKEKGISSVDVVKIDVEGAEIRVFEGMHETFSKNPRLKIIAELWAGIPSQFEALRAFANKYSFKIQLITWEGLVPTTFDELPREFCDIVLYRD